MTMLEIIQSSIMLSKSMQLIRSGIEAPFGEITKTTPVCLNNNLNDGDPKEWKGETDGAVNSKAEWIIFDNQPTKYDFMTMNTLVGMNDSQRLCRKAEPYSCARCSDDSCLPCLIRNASFDTHELRTSLWVIGFVAHLYFIFKFGAMRVGHFLLKFYHYFYKCFL